MLLRKLIFFCMVEFTTLYFFKSFLKKFCQLNFVFIFSPTISQFGIYKPISLMFLADCLSSTNLELYSHVLSKTKG